MTNHGIEFTKKDGFQSNDISDLIGERKKMGVKTNHGIKFTKKRWVREQQCIRFHGRKRKKRWGSRQTMEQNLLKKDGFESNCVLDFIEERK